MSDHTSHIKWVAVYDNDISIFSLFKGANAVCDTGMFSRVDCYSTKSIEFIHSGFDCKSCAEREMMERNYRCICDNGNMTACFCKNSWGLPGLILKLKFCGMTKGRTNSKRKLREYPKVCVNLQTDVR